MDKFKIYTIPRQRKQVEEIFLDLTMVKCYITGLVETIDVIMSETDERNIQKCIPALVNAIRMHSDKIGECLDKLDFES